MGVGILYCVILVDFLLFLQVLFSDGGMFICNGFGVLMSVWVVVGWLIGYYELYMNLWDVLLGLVLMCEVGGVSNDFLVQEGIQCGNLLLLVSLMFYLQLKKMIL